IGCRHRCKDTIKSRAKEKQAFLLPRRSIFGEAQDTIKSRAKEKQAFLLPRRSIFGEAKMKDLVSWEINPTFAPLKTAR
ncbi:MAG: hypothetical protein NC324_04400, partial [Bacteroides sp.]|nr:hypothetical protein [Bacteroides sp.]